MYGETSAANKKLIGLIEMMIMLCDCADGKNVAVRRHCKFIDVSALLDHRMDEHELLSAFTRQLSYDYGRLGRRPASSTAALRGDSPDQTPTSRPQSAA